MGNHIPKAMALKMRGQDSCLHCELLYYQDRGYSNYTVEVTDVCCALDQNPKLPADKPFDWNEKPYNDNWPLTQHGLCTRFLPITPNEEHTDHVYFDVDHERTLADFPNISQEAQKLIKKHNNP